MTEALSGKIPTTSVRRAISRLKRSSGLMLRGLGQCSAGNAYLVIPGSLVAYGAFVWLLANVPVTTVSTYAYVSPVVAVAVTLTIAAGAVVVLASVAVLVSPRV
jgi:hypothetical protein